MVLPSISHGADRADANAPSGCIDITAVCTSSSYSITGELAMTWRLYITLPCIMREEKKLCIKLSLADFVKLSM